MNQRKGQRTMHRTALHRTIALPLAAILLALALSASVAASESDPDAPPPDPTSTGAAPLRPDAAPPRPDGAPLRPDAAPLRPDAAPLRPDAAPLRPDAAPLRPDAAPPRPDGAPPPDPTSTGAAPLRPDAVAGATAGSFAVYLPLVVRPEPYPPVNRAWELEFIRLLNEERARHGLHPLREHPLLTLAARRHAYDLGINKVPRGDCGGGRGHTGTDGTWPWHRMEWAGYPGRYDGEAVSCGAHEVQYALQGLLNSPPHRAFLLSPIPVEIGVGAHPVLDQWGGYSTVMLGGTPNP
jgi:uncharacterized protein YkwD